MSLNRIQYKICLVCETSFPKKVTVSLKEWSERKYCTRKCHNMAKRDYVLGKKNPNWKGGTTTVRGYPAAERGDKKVYRHRLIMEEALGRSLSFDEIVHHINHDRKDNRLENLMVMTRAEHTRSHKLGLI